MTSPAKIGAAAVKIPIRALNSPKNDEAFFSGATDMTRLFAPVAKGLAKKPDRKIAGNSQVVDEPIKNQPAKNKDSPSVAAITMALTPYRSHRLDQNRLAHKPNKMLNKKKCQLGRTPRQRRKR
jgi:hypothetical protein